ncbi:MAG TPA: transcription repressor NadR [Firmicutes bacterium]|nr:transcription repressor NadR [Candidatus Fermentithermobacillaceae bacterium]
MNAETRRARILSILKEESPVTGSSLSARLGVTRQVIVQDITILRAQGEKIIATPRGYTMLDESASPGVTKLVAVRHSPEETGAELYAIVDEGAEVLDVIVDHPIYGQLTGQLSLTCRRDVDLFLKALSTTKAGLLSSLTGGIHLHTVRAKDASVVRAVERSLASKGFLLPE